MLLLLKLRKIDNSTKTFRYFKNIVNTERFLKYVPFVSSTVFVNSEEKKKYAIQILLCTKSLHRTKNMIKYGVLSCSIIS